MRRINPLLPNKRIYINEDDKSLFDYQYGKYAIDKISATGKNKFLKTQEKFLKSKEGSEFQKFKTKIYTKIQGIEVYFIDGEKLRNDTVGFVDFTMGGHGNRYLFIPQNEIWIDPLNISSAEINSVMWHEFGERLWMGQGLSYLKAHSLATINEIAMRNCRFRLPVGTYRQSAPGFCGPACLKIISDYLSENFTERQFVLASGMSPSIGMTGVEIVKTSKKMGLKAFARENFTLDEVIKLLKAGFPVIANHWVDEANKTDEGHYAVIAGFDMKSREFLISDPSEDEGYVLVNIKKFMKSWYELDDKTTREGVIVYKGNFPAGLI